MPLFPDALPIPGTFISIDITSPYPLFPLDVYFPALNCSYACFWYNEASSSELFLPYPYDSKIAFLPSS